MIRAAAIGLAAVAVLLVWRFAGAPRAPAGAAATSFTWSAWRTTLAGDGAGGFIDGAARSARFANPFGVAVGADGTLYLADGGDNNRIRKLAPDGSVSTLAGGAEGYADGPSTSARFHTPSGLAADSSGNLYVADTGNNAIRKISAEGVVTTVAGNGQPGFRDGAPAQAQFNGPIGIALDTDGRLYVADTYNDRIRMIAVDGQVTTLAGGDRPGYLDGAGAQARFDTPSALARDADGNLFIADMKNNAIRKLGANGQVSTVLRAEPGDRQALLRKPIGLAVTHDGYLYVAETGRGRIVQISPSGAVRALPAATPNSVDAVIQVSDPAGLALGAKDELYVTDAGTNQLIRLAAVAPAVAEQPEPPLAARPPAPSGRAFPWPVLPQNQWHEVIGTMGEVRGNYAGESRDHFHGGLDVQGEMGARVVAVAAEKISNPLPNWDFGGLNEGLAMDAMSYIHMRVGRTAQNLALDPRFVVMQDEAGKPDRVRIKRGTRFQVGDSLGTINRMFHVHLDLRQAGAQWNPMILPFTGFADHVAPRIDSIQVLDQSGRRLLAKRRGRLLIERQAGAMAIVVDAFDQVDANQARRRLGLYKLGYQVLQANGSPVPGFEQPRITIEFNRLPADREAVKIAYADSSGITVHGSKETRFLYTVTNTVRDGMAATGSWNAAGLPPGDYILRILAADYAGNVAVSRRDLNLTVE